MNQARDNIYISGEYLQKNPTWGREDSEWKAKEILKLIKKNNLSPDSVVEAGCGFGEILICLAEMDKDISVLKGYDISPQAIAEAQKNTTERVKFFHADFTAEKNASADIVLVVDVIEHLENYFDFLKKISTQGNNFIFHIPLDLSCRTIFKSHVLLQQRKDVGHLHYFTREHVEWILADSGFIIKDWHYTLSETDRRRSHKIKHRFKKFLRKISFSLAKEMSVKLWGGYSIMIYCQKHE